MRAKSSSAKKPAEQVVKDIRRATRRHFSAEDKIRIVLEGLRGDDSIAELCRKEGIAQSLYYVWSKELMEAGKRRPCRHHRRGQGPAPRGQRPEGVSRRPEGQHDLSDLAMPAVPGAGLIVVEAELVFGGLEAVLDRPAVAFDSNHGVDAGPRWTPGGEEGQPGR